MYGSRGTITIRYFISVGLILSCLTGLLLAQTFQYSRGWTNGKKRSPMSLPGEERNDEPESFGICQMQRLKHIIEHRHHGETYLPCEIFERAEDDVSRLRGSFDTPSVVDSLPFLKNQGYRKIEGI